MAPPIRKTTPPETTPAVPAPPVPVDPDPVHTSILGLRQTLESVISESAAYRREVEEFKEAQAKKDALRDRQRRRENTIGLLVAVALSVPILIMLGLLAQNIGIARNAERSAAEAKKTSDLIADCITPTGKCFQDGSKRTGGAVIILRRDVGLTVWCSKITTTLAAQDKCVADLVATTPIPVTPAPTTSPAP